MRRQGASANLILWRTAPLVARARASRSMSMSLRARANSANKIVEFAELIAAAMSWLVQIDFYDPRRSLMSRSAILAGGSTDAGVIWVKEYVVGGNCTIYDYCEG